MNYGFIYIIKNKVNDKVYIGQTILSVEERFRQHMKPSAHKRRYKIYKAINKYGANNFYYEILEEKVPIDKLDELERFYIEKYDSFKNGYNSTKGGDGRLINKIEDIEYIIKSLEEGKTYNELAEELDVCTATIYRTLRKENKTSRKIKATDKEELARLYKLGFTYNEISDKLGINPRSVSRMIKKIDIPLRGKGKGKQPRRSDYSMYNNVIDDYIKGLTWSQLMQKYDITRSVLSVMIKDYKENSIDYPNDGSRAEIDTARSATHLND